MDCLHGSGKYGFFDEIKNYIQNEKEIHTGGKVFPSLEGCKWIFLSSKRLKNFEIVKGICEDFTKLYKTLGNVEGDANTISIKDNAWGFLNFWLNYKLKENNINENICINRFYDSIEAYFTDIFRGGLAIGKIYDIENDDYNNMKALYVLYEKYSKLHNILSNPLKVEESVTLDSSNDCFVDYIKAKAPCIDKHSTYCGKLEKFKSTYQALFSIEGNKTQEFNDNFKKLPEDSEVSELLSTILFDENFHSIVTIPLILSIFGLILLFFLFYKVKRN